MRAAAAGKIVRRSKVKAGDLEALLSQGHREGASAAADIQDARACGQLRGDELAQQALARVPEVRDGEAPAAARSVQTACLGAAADASLFLLGQRRP